jgi:DnaJ like chaperone protein
MWWGKIIGALIGYLLAGWAGAIAGFILGHLSDLSRGHQAFSLFSGPHQSAQEFRQAFFQATFEVLGHVAKSDGRIDDAELNAARQVMQRLGLTDEQRRQAMLLFNEGKSPEFNLDSTLTLLIQSCRGNFILLHVFADMQMQAARASGSISREKQQILQQIFQRVGYVPFEFYFSQSSQGHRYQQSTAFSAGNKLKQAYALLSVTENSTNDEIKHAYRKLMSQHHPDKLIAKGLPEEMMKLATEKAQNIQLAYDLIRQTRGF